MHTLTNDFVISGFVKVYRRVYYKVEVKTRVCFFVYQHMLKILVPNRDFRKTEKNSVWNWKMCKGSNYGL